MTTHRFQYRRVDDVEIEQNVAGVPVFGIGMNVDVASLAIAQAEETDGGSTHQLSCRPQAFAGEGSARGVMNQTDQVKTLRHGPQLVAHRLPGKEKSTVQHVIMLRPKWIGYNRVLANGKCVFSGVYHKRGSPHRSAFIGVRLRLYRGLEFLPNNNMGRR